ncbi:unnamed protein product [Amoebophrya sp. A25]|nr:unnamed protein product [Amoebophrya sp. A25]|eukprot:GSA25T00007352001.1
MASQLVRHPSMSSMTRAALALLATLVSTATSRSHQESATSVAFRPPAVPLLVQDPYISVWSTSDTLSASQTQHWNGDPVPLVGALVVDGVCHRFLGSERDAKYALGGGSSQVSCASTLPQIGLPVVNATTTTYTFQILVDEEGGSSSSKILQASDKRESLTSSRLLLRVRFTTAAFVKERTLLRDLPDIGYTNLSYHDALSLPSTFVDIEVVQGDGVARLQELPDMQIRFGVSSAMVVSDPTTHIGGGIARLQFYPYDREEPIKMEVAGVWNAGHDKKSHFNFNNFNKSIRDDPKNTSNKKMTMDRINWGCFHVIGEIGDGLPWDPSEVTASIQPFADRSTSKSNHVQALALMSFKFNSSTTSTTSTEISTSRRSTTPVWEVLRRARITLSMDEGDIGLEYFGRKLPPYWQALPPALEEKRLEKTEGGQRLLQDHKSLNSLNDHLSERHHSNKKANPNKASTPIARSIFMQKVLSRSILWRDALIKASSDFDEEIGEALASTSEKYARLGHLAYRQCTGAMKVVADEKAVQTSSTFEDHSVGNHDQLQHEVDDHEKNHVPSPSSAASASGTATTASPLVFVKEISSDGDISTVDVIAPMSPFLLYFNPRLLTDLLEPVLRYANNETAGTGDTVSRTASRINTGDTTGADTTGEGSFNYTLPWAPHDLGTWPVANRHASEQENMPIEETGNMLILLSLADKLTKMNQVQVVHDGDIREEHDEASKDNTATKVRSILSSRRQEPFTREDHLNKPTTTRGTMKRTTSTPSTVPRTAQLLKSWADYLVSTLPDPENELCTDDFEGPSAHNANLAVKGIVALAAYSLTTEHDKYLTIAQDYATKWMKLAAVGEDHYKLAYNDTGRAASFSLKYNLFYQAMLLSTTTTSTSEPQQQTTVFPVKEVIDRELSYYKSQQREKYGVPLDSRATFTKLDHLSMIYALDGDKDNYYVDSIFSFANSTPDRIPLTDWYDTKTAAAIGMSKGLAFRARPVVGAVFAKALLDSLNKTSIELRSRQSSSSSPDVVGHHLARNKEKHDLSLLNYTTSKSIARAARRSHVHLQHGPIAKYDDMLLYQ